METITLPQYPEEDTDTMTEVVRATVDSFRIGQIVAVPTETVYGIGCLATDAVAVRRLLKIKGRKSGHPIALAISGVAMFDEFVPNSPVLANRLARRCWPGPLTLVLDVSGNPAFATWPDDTKMAVMPEGKVAFRVPKHPATEQILKGLDSPILLTSANRTGEPAAQTAAEVEKNLGSEIDVLLWDATATDEYERGGSSVIAKPSTVLEITPENERRILRLGAMSEEFLRLSCAKMILFVCTGNTCRSPMAEVFCKMSLAKHLGIPTDFASIANLEDSLARAGYVVRSAGVITMEGMPASGDALRTMSVRGLSLGKHSASTVNDRLLRFADVIFTMTQNHRNRICSDFPDAAPRTCLLRTDGNDVSDPFCSDTEKYEYCASQIAAEIEKQMPRILD